MNQIFKLHFKFLFWVVGMSLAFNNAVYANTPQQNQCAKLFAAKSPSFAAFINAGIRQQQAAQKQKAEAQSLLQDQLKKEEELKRAEVYQTVDPVHRARKIKFIKILPRKFKMGKDIYPVDVEITKPYEIMDAKMTQMMYIQFMIIFNAMPRHTSIFFPQFSDGPNSIMYNYLGNEVPMRPDDPITSVNWMDIHDIFLPKLNEFSKSDNDYIQSLLKILIPDHRRGDVYDFVTDAQMVNVLQIAKNEDGETMDEMIAQNDQAKIGQYVVNSQNSDFNIGTYPEASQKPFYINGQKIYLVGNVREWMKDSRDRLGSLRSGQDPVGTQGVFRSVRGTSWVDSITYPSTSSFFGSPRETTSRIGFRLARISRVGMHFNTEGAP